jgi:hypothetical protein
MDATISASNAAGPLAGWWFADAGRGGEALVAAGLLMLTAMLILMNLTGGCGTVGSGGAERWCRTAQNGWPTAVPSRMVLDRGVRQTY